MKNIVIFCLILLLVNAQAPQGNLLRCFAEIGKTAAGGVQLGLSIKTGNPAGILKGVRDIVGQIDPMMRECSNPICLVEAQKRCESDSQKKCEAWGAIMYPKCADGFYPQGCCLCTSQCPEGYRDDGFFCAKPSSYGRGGGYPWKFGDGFNLDGAWRRCQNDNPKNGCEQNGALIYPKCATNFHAVGCCVCSPNCPSGYNDIGVSCQKKAYGRGAGYPMYYSDCSSTSVNNPPPVVFHSNLTIDQLKGKMVELVEQLNKNKENAEESVKIVTQLSSVLADYDAKVSAQN